MLSLRLGDSSRLMGPDDAADGTVFAYIWAKNPFPRQLLLSLQRRTWSSKRDRGLGVTCNGQRACHGGSGDVCVVYFLACLVHVFNGRARVL